jgi:simple sugar transport system substrate-binding protein
MKSNLRTIVLGSCIVVATAIAVYGQTGGLLMKAVGGYSFEQAAKEAPETKNFHSCDGKLTFAIVTHTAGNGGAQSLSG